MKTKLIMTVFLAALITVLTAWSLRSNTADAAEPVPYTSKWGDYTTVIPDGWKESCDAEERHFTDTHFRAPERYYSLSIRWYTRYSTHKLSNGLLEMYSGADDYISQTLNLYKDSKLVEPVHDVEIGALKAKGFIRTFPRIKADDVPKVGNLGVFVRDEVTENPSEPAYTVVTTQSGFYVLIYFAPQGGYDKYVKLYKQMVSSFAPKNGPEKAIAKEGPEETLARYVSDIQAQREKLRGPVRVWVRTDEYGIGVYRTLMGWFADTALQKKIIELVSTMKPAPVIPEEAQRSFTKGTTFMKAAKEASDYKYAIDAYEEALFKAPWWGDAYYNLGIALEAAGSHDDAVESVKLYLLTKPGDADAAQAQKKIWEFEAKKELEEKKKWKKMSDLRSTVEAAEDAYSKGNYAKAMEMYKKLAEHGQQDGSGYNLGKLEVRIGFMYDKGQGVAQDKAEAAKWYRKGAEDGNEQGMYNIGVMYKNGWGVPYDLNEAVGWFRKAAEKGHEDAKKKLRELER